MQWPSPLLLMLLLLCIHRLPVAAAAALEKRLLAVQTLLPRVITTTTSRPAAPGQRQRRIVFSHWRNQSKSGIAVSAGAGSSRWGGRRQQLDGNAALAWGRGGGSRGFGRKQAEMER